jgi:hypothetical protein
MNNLFALLVAFVKSLSVVGIKNIRLRSVTFNKKGKIDEQASMNPSSLKESLTSLAKVASEDGATFEASTNSKEMLDQCRVLVEKVIATRELVNVVPVPYAFVGKDGQWNGYKIGTKRATDEEISAQLESL